MGQWRSYLFFFLGTGFFLAVILISCSQKQVTDMMPANPQLKGQAPHHEEIAETDVTEELRPAFFDYDQDFLRADAKNAIQANAQWLKKNPEVMVQIEGHCDERGTREYNYKLGERRANNAKDLLVKFGISPKRLSTVSYGALAGQNQKTWASNRKAVFVLIYPKAAE